MIRTTRHTAARDHNTEDCGFQITTVLIDRPPVGRMTPLEAIMCDWWIRAGGYPVGRPRGTVITRSPT